MTDKELRHMSRAELLELLLAQRAENEKLKKRLDETEKALSDQRIAIDETGTLAEAALKLGGVFEAADRAVKIYLTNIRRQNAESRDGL